MNDALWGIMLTALGALLIKLVERWLPSSDKKTDDMASYRKELREDNTNLRAEVHQLELNNDTKDQQIAQLMGRVEQLERELTFWKQRVTALELNQRTRLQREDDAKG